MNKAALVDVRWQGRTDQSSAVSETCIITMVTLTTVPGICVFQKWKRKTLLLASWNYDSAAQQLYKGAAQRNNSPWRWRRSASDILIVCVSMQKKKLKETSRDAGGRFVKCPQMSLTRKEGVRQTENDWGGGRSRSVSSTVELIWHIKVSCRCQYLGQTQSNSTCCHVSTIWPVSTTSTHLIKHSFGLWLRPNWIWWDPKTDAGWRRFGFTLSWAWGQVWTRLVILNLTLNYSNNTQVNTSFFFVNIKSKQVNKQKCKSLLQYCC